MGTCFKAQCACMRDKAMAWGSLSWTTVPCKQSPGFHRHPASCCRTTDVHGVPDAAGDPDRAASAQAFACAVPLARSLSSWAPLAHLLTTFPAPRASHSELSTSFTRTAGSKLAGELAPVPRSHPTSHILPSASPVCFASKLSRRDPARASPAASWAQLQGCTTRPCTRQAPSGWQPEYSCPPFNLPTSSSPSENNTPSLATASTLLSSAISPPLPALQALCQAAPPRDADMTHRSTPCSNATFREASVITFSNKAASPCRPLSPRPAHWSQGPSLLSIRVNTHLTPPGPRRQGAQTVCPALPEARVGTAQCPLTMC